MHSAMFITLLVFVAPVCAKELTTNHTVGDVVDMLVSKVADRAFGRSFAVSPFHAADLDGTTLGKSGNEALGEGRRQEEERWPMSGTDFESTALGKPVQLSIRPRVSTALLPPSYPGATRAVRPLRHASALGSQPVSYKAEEVEAINRGETAADWDVRGGTVTRYPPRLWPAVYKYLLERGLKSVTNEEARQMVKWQGAVLVDVRSSDATLVGSYNKGTIEGAMNVPLFQKVVGMSPFDNARRGMMSFFGMEATERNPNLEKMALELLPKNKPIIIFCNRGGTLDKGVITLDEFQKPMYTSRSLKAAYELYQCGFSKLYFLEGGIEQWESDGLPMMMPSSA
jgi:rhodanese-related sulfurtransferase